MVGREAAVRTGGAVHRFVAKTHALVQIKCRINKH